MYGGSLCFTGARDRASWLTLTQRFRAALRVCVHAAMGDLEVTRANFECMRDGQWLNDEARVATLR
jgi:hypothetical protein